MFIFWVFKEFDEPMVLLEDPNSLFSSLVQQTGDVEANELKQLAKQVIIYTNALHVRLTIINVF